MKITANFHFAFVLGFSLFACLLARAEGQLYQNAHHGFQLVAPTGWTVTETNFELFHYNDAFLTINSQRPDLTITEQPHGNNSMEFGLDTILQQLRPGEVYVSFGYAGSPMPDTMRPDTVGGDLQALLATNHISTSQPGMSVLNLRFFKRGHEWDVAAYLKNPVTEENRWKLTAMLESFRFLDAPVGNAGWAESLAWQELPEQIRAAPSWSWGMGWPAASWGAEQWGTSMNGPRFVEIHKLGDAYAVKFTWDGVGTWEYAVSTDGKVQSKPPVVYALSRPSSELPSDLPGDNKGVVDTYWIAPNVQAATAFGQTTLTWFTKDGHIERQTVANHVNPESGFVEIIGHPNEVEGINENWRLVPHKFAAGPFGGYLTATPDSRVLFDEFSPQPGLIALDISIHGKRVNSVGPFIPCYPSADVAFNEDGSAALLIWQDESKTNVQIVVMGTNGGMQFRADCGRAIWDPLVGPEGAGVLLRPNGGGEDRNTLTWFTQRGKQCSMEVSPNAECAGWIPHTRKSLFMTSLGNESRRFQLIDWDTGRRCWDISPFCTSSVAVWKIFPFLSLSIDSIHRGGICEGKNKPEAKAAGAHRKPRQNTMTPGVVQPST